MGNWLALFCNCPEPVDYRRRLFRMQKTLNQLLKRVEEGNLIMANNFDRLTAAVQSVSDNVAEVADAIRNPDVDNNDQTVIDDLAGRLEAASAALDTAIEEENAEDGTSPAPEPTPEPAPEPEPEEPVA